MGRTMSRLGKATDSARPRAPAVGFRFQGRHVGVTMRPGAGRSISTVDALPEELHRTQGHVDWLAGQLAARPQDAKLLAAHAAESGHLAKPAGQSVTGELDQQRWMLSEQAVGSLELALTDVPSDPGHDPASDYVRGVSARHLCGYRRARSRGCPGVGEAARDRRRWRSAMGEGCA